MRRDLQNNEIRTNIIVEFNVTGLHAANFTTNMVAALPRLAKERGLKVHMVGINLKKPTASFEILSNLNLSVGELFPSMDIDQDESQESSEEEVNTDDEESD